MRTVPGNGSRNRQIPNGNERPCGRLQIDVDDPDMLEIVRRYNISSVPTLVIFRRGEVLWRRSGLIGYRELREAFDTIEQREHAVHH